MSFIDNIDALRLFIVLVVFYLIAYSREKRWASQVYAWIRTGVANSWKKLKKK